MAKHALNTFSGHRLDLSGRVLAALPRSCTGDNFETVFAPLDGHSLEVRWVEFKIINTENVSPFEYDGEFCTACIYQLRSHSDVFDVKVID